MCNDIMEIWFGTSYWQISSVFDRVICPQYDNGGVLSFQVVLFIFFFCCFVFFEMITCEAYHNNYDNYVLEQDLPLCK